MANLESISLDENWKKLNLETGKKYNLQNRGIANALIYEGAIPKNKDAFILSVNDNLFVEDTGLDIFMKSLFKETSIAIAEI